MNIKIFCRCSFFLPGRAKDLSAPLLLRICLFLEKDHPGEAKMWKLLGAFAELPKATINFLSVRESSWNTTAPIGEIFMKFDI